MVLSLHISMLSLPNRLMCLSYQCPCLGEMETPIESRVLWKYLEGICGSFWVNIHAGLMNCCWIAIYCRVAFMFGDNIVGEKAMEADELLFYLQRNVEQHT